MGFYWLVDHTKALILKTKLKNVTFIKQPAKCIPNKDARIYVIIINLFCNLGEDNVFPYT